MTQIGPYRVLEELARGGMGVVYRAQAPDGAPTALKLLLAHRAANPRARQRFQLEAQTLARLRHPNVVAILGAGEHEGAPWIALDYVEGESLEDRLRAGPLPIPQAIRIASDLAKALAYVHTCGVLHRDLKPGNVLLSDAGAQLTDFGLAKDPSASSSELTATGVFLGTPGFWPPEQANAERDKVGPRSDLYGLGAVLYACLTGRAPISAGSLQEYMARASVSEIAPPHALREAVPRWLSDLCMRCLQTDPKRRPRSAGEVELALARGAEAGNPPRRLPRLLAWGALATAASTSLALGMHAFLMRDPTPPPAATPAGEPGPASPAADPASRVRTLLDEGLRAGKAGRPEEALRLFDAALRLDPACAEAHGNRGSANFGLGRDHQALEDFSRAIELDPRDPRFWERRGKVKAARGRDAEALRDLNEALRLRPTSTFALFLRGNAKLSLDDFEGAITDYDRLLALDPDDARALNNRGLAKRQLGRHRDAIADLNRAETLQGRPTPLIQVNRGASLCSLGRYAAALEELDACLRSLPQHASALYWRGVTLRHLGREAEAVAALDAALRVEPRQARSYAERGLAALKLGRYEAAAADFTRALELRPEHAESYFNRGTARAALGAPAAAISDFTRALELDPRDVNAYVSRGVQRRRLGERDAALADYLSALALEPGHPGARLNRANLLVDLDQTEEALAAYDALLDEVDLPADVRALAERARAKARRALDEGAE